MPDPLFVDNRYPEPGTDQNARDGYISLDLLDPEDSVRIPATRIDINGNTAFDGSVDGYFLPPFDSYASSLTHGTFDGYDGYAYDGYRIVLQTTTDFASFDLVSVRVVSEDAGGHTVDTTYSFRIEDYEPPLFTDRDPAPGQTGVDQNTLVGVTVYDTGSGVDTSMLMAMVNGQWAYSGGFVAPFDGPGSSLSAVSVDGYDGYRLVLDATYEYTSAQPVSVTVSADDEEGNNSTSSWLFTITDWVSPFLRNRLPAPETAGNILQPIIRFDVLDDATGVDLSSVCLYVASDLAFDGAVFVGDFSGSINPVVIDGYDGYRFQVQRGTPFAESSAVEVRVAAEDKSADSLPLDEDYWTWTFYTTASIRAVSQGPFEITLDVLFSGPMLSGGAIVDPANYIFSGGMYARLAKQLSDRSVRLWVEGYQGSEPFTLTVSPNVKDDYGGSLYGDFAKMTGLLPFQSEATMSGTNGLVRTWAGRGENFPEQGARLVSMDSQRIYMSGLRGLEVFRRLSGGRVSRWAQVFEQSGISALFVANYDGDYVFDDASPPFLEDRVPAPSSTDAPRTTDVRFSVSDLGTAVEISAVVVYINGLVAFAGGSGWANGWSGDIIVRHRSLDFILRPSSPFTPETTVSVRIVAYDLMDNLLDESYSFLISAVPEGGFGESGFGETPFGGTS